MRLGLIADDLTGANDTGVQFALRGARTFVPLDWHDLKSLTRAADVLVLNTNSRAVPARAAAERMAPWRRRISFRTASPIPGCSS